MQQRQVNSQCIDTHGDRKNDRKVGEKGARAHDESRHKVEDESEQGDLNEKDRNVGDDLSDDVGERVEEGKAFLFGQDGSAFEGCFYLVHGEKAADNGFSIQLGCSQTLMYSRVIDG